MYDLWNLNLYLKENDQYIFKIWKNVLQIYISSFWNLEYLPIISDFLDYGKNLFHICDKKNHSV